MLGDENIKELSDIELKKLAINCYSCIRENGKKINYMQYIKSLKNDECNNAIIRIVPKINIDKIDTFIDNIDCMSLERKEFYKKIIKLRYEIIEQVYNKLNNV